MQILKDLILEEVSLVDRPANAQAEVALFKRDNPEGVVEKMTDYEKKVKAYMEKGYTEDEAKKMCDRDMKAEKFDELEVKVDLMKADNEAMRKCLIEDGYVISAEGITKKAPEEQIEVSGEMVNKKDIPAPVLKALEEAEAQKVDVALTKRAGELLPNMPVEKAKAFIKSFEEDKELMEFLAALDAAIGANFEEFGKSDAEGDLGGAQEKLNKMVQEYKDQNKVSFEKAFEAVSKTAEGKKLIAAHYNKEDE